MQAMLKDNDDLKLSEIHKRAMIMTTNNYLEMFVVRYKDGASLVKLKSEYD